MHSHLPADLLPLLCCTGCHSPLNETAQGCVCTVCGREFPAVRGVLRFVDPHNYADSFGYQWQKFSKTQLTPEFSEWNLRRKTGLREEDLKGKVVLDVGCGMGRFADVATRWGARVIGIDLSTAAEVAARNMAGRNFTAIQADVLNLPFVPGSFDCIYSVGVLHHTPDCEKAFKNLPQYLKPGGSIAVWLYGGYNNWYRFSDQYRKITHRMSIQKLYAVLRVAVPLFFWLDRGLRAIPVIGRPVAGLVHHVFPVSRNPNPEVRILDTLDWYSPKYQSKHKYEQVFRWFENCGLEALTVGDMSISVKGRKPSAAGGGAEELQHDSSEDFGASLQTTPVLRGTPSSTKPPKRVPLSMKVSRTMRWLPAYAWRRIARRAPSGKVHLMIALADHFEPAIVPYDGSARAPHDEQERRLELWCREYPPALDSWRDNEGRPFVHTYYYPAEQYDRALLDRLSRHCQSGWGEVEIHLHHGVGPPDTEANTRRELLRFRNILASEHRNLSYLDGEGPPRYSFVHGNFALANSAGGRYCGVDSELQILADTGCCSDFTLPPGPYHRAHIAKINSLYECSLPLQRKAAHRRGRDLECGRRPQVFPLIVEGPLLLRIGGSGLRLISVENGSVSAVTPPDIHRLELWKRAGIAVRGRPDWLFIKLHCHGMDPRDREVMLGEPMREFLRQLVEGAQQRSETVHFVSAREMTNIILAACDGREGNPGDYRDYRLKRTRRPETDFASSDTERMALRD